MIPRFSPWLSVFLKSYEKFRPTAYCATSEERAKGIWTLGYGHTKGVKEGDTCTMAQALATLELDMEDDHAALERHVTVMLTVPQVDALCSLVHNIGETQFRGSTLLDMLNKGAPALASAQFKRWDRQAGVELPGLEKRRVAEAARFVEVA